MVGDFALCMSCKGSGKNGYYFVHFGMTQTTEVPATLFKCMLCNGLGWVRVTTPEPIIWGSK